jgi:hypothetical protein
MRIKITDTSAFASACASGLPIGFEHTFLRIKAYALRLCLYQTAKDHFVS